MFVSDSSASKESTCNAGNPSSIPGSGRSPGWGHGNPLQHSCLENPHGQRSRAGYSSYGCKGSDTTEWLSIAHNCIQLYTTHVVLSVSIILQQKWKEGKERKQPKISPHLTCNRQGESCELRQRWGLQGWVWDVSTLPRILGSLGAWKPMSRPKHIQAVRGQTVEVHSSECHTGRLRSCWQATSWSCWRFVMGLSRRIKCTKWGATVKLSQAGRLVRKLPKHMPTEGARWVWIKAEIRVTSPGRQTRAQQRLG